MLEVSPHRHPFYLAGRAARLNGLSRDACPFRKLTMCSYTLWLAGWGDADMEKQL